MRFPRFLLILGVLVCPTHVTAQSRVPETDNQSWNDLQITVPMTKKVDFTTQMTLRLGDNVTQTADQRWGIGFLFKPNNYLSFTTFYFHLNATLPIDITESLANFNTVLIARYHSAHS